LWADFFTIWALKILGRLEILGKKVLFYISAKNFFLLKPPLSPS